MAENKYAEFYKKTTGSQSTAAWASMDHVDEVSGVSFPDEDQVINARQFVEENKK